MDKLESSVCADWTVLEEAREKLREACDLLKTVHLAGIDRKTKGYDASGLAIRARSLDEMIVIIAQQCASHLEWSRHVRYARQCKRQYDAGTIGYDAYWEGKWYHKEATRSRIDDIFSASSIEGIRGICFPELNDLPF